MTYLTLEQCKKLKDLGFPQKTDFAWLERSGSSPMIIYRVFGKGSTISIPKYETACPSLEELIEWLDIQDSWVDLNGSYGKIETGPGIGKRVSGKWVASLSGKTPMGGLLHQMTAEGENPLNAIFNLILAIKS